MKSYVHRLARDLQPWPPEAGFLASDLFGRTLISLAECMAREYPGLDFSDAVALVFDWFDRKAVGEPDFLDHPRFEDALKFIAYLQRSLLNAARQAYRKRRRDERIRAQAVDESPANWQPSSDFIRLWDYLDRLPWLHREVLEDLLFHGRSLEDVAAARPQTRREIDVIFREAVDRIARMMEAEDEPPSSQGAEISVG